MYTSNLKINRTPLARLISNLKSQKRLIYSAITCSILNKFFDLAPPVLIGISVDVVVRKEIGLSLIHISEPTRPY